MTEHVRTEIAEGIMTLTLARADKKNALSNAMYSALSDGLERAEKDPAVRVVLFQGDGDSFTAGNDLADFAAQASGKDTGEPQAHRFIGNLGKATSTAHCRRARQRGRRRHHDVAPLRPGVSCRHCKADDTVCKSGAGSGGGLKLAAASPDRARPRIRDVCAGRTSRCSHCIGLRFGERRGAGRKFARQGPPSCRSSDQTTGRLS
jgi:hypothetical protein